MSVPPRPAAYPFTVTVSAEDNTSSTTVKGTLIIVSSGVYVELEPYGGVAPGGTIDAYVFNYGSATDTFNLSLSGPAAAVATFAQSSVTIASENDQEVQITTGPATFATSGNLPLTVTATSADQYGRRG